MSIIGDHTVVFVAFFHSSIALNIGQQLWYSESKLMKLLDHVNDDSKKTKLENASRRLSV